MPTIQISGQLLGMNGNPINNAQITIIDNDLGSSNDLIYSGRTGSQGMFRGTSSNWQDNNWVDGPLGLRIPVPDILSLYFKVKKGDRQHSGPFVLLPNNTSAPIIVPWSEQVVFATVNGIECFSASEVQRRIMSESNSANSVNVNIYDPVLKAAFEPITRSERALRDFVQSSTPSLSISGQTNIPFALDPFTGTALILLAISAIILAAGATTGITLVGLGINYAIRKCSHVQANMTLPDASGGLEGIQTDSGVLSIEISGCQ